MGGVSCDAENGLKTSVAEVLHPGCTGFILALQASGIKPPDEPIQAALGQPAGAGGHGRAGSALRVGRKASGREHLAGWPVGDEESRDERRHRPVDFEKTFRRFVVAGGGRFKASQSELGRERRPPVQRKRRPCYHGRR